MSSVIITHLILQYRYWILVPLCFIEGPIVAFVAGALTPLGYFNIYLLCIIFFCRDIIVDVSMYALGRFGGQTRFASWLLSKIGVTEEHLNSVHRLWDKYTMRTMFFSKLSYGISATFLTVAGLVRTPLKKFLACAVTVTIVQYGGLLALGYYFGDSFGTVSNILNNLGLVLLGVSLFVTGYYIFTHIMRRRLMRQERDGEK